MKKEESGRIVWGIAFVIGCHFALNVLGITEIKIFLTDGGRSSSSTSLSVYSVIATSWGFIGLYIGSPYFFQGIFDFSWFGSC